MARILDETFRSQGFNESWVEVVAAGCSLDENFSVLSFTAGTTPSANFHRFCAKFSTDGDATPDVKISTTLTSYYPICYLRFEFMIISSNATACAIMGLAGISDSNGASLCSFNTRWTSTVNALQLQVRVMDSTTETTTSMANITPYTTYNVEFLWDQTNENAIAKLNSTIVSTLKISAGVGVTRTVHGFRLGNLSNGTCTQTVYFDNIILRDDTWPNSVGSGYDDPLRTCEYLSTQKSISMEL